MTPIRRTAFSELFAAGQPLSAYTLLARLQRRMRKQIAPLTVYRALDFLVEQNLVHRIETRNAFVACAEPDEQHKRMLHLVCTCCGAAEELYNQEVQELLAREAKKRHFKALKPVVEVQGLCHSCVD